MLKLLCIILLPLSLYAQDNSISENFYIKNHSSASISVSNSNIFLNGSFPYVIEAMNQQLYSCPLNSDRGPSFITMNFKSGSIERNYLVYPNDTLNVYFINNVPQVKLSNKKREKEFQFMNDLFYDIKESEFFGVKTISKSESLARRDVYFESIYKKQLDYLNRHGDEYGLSESFKKIFRHFMFSKMIISKYERQIHLYKFASGIKDFYRDEFTHYIDSFNCRELFATKAYKQAAMIVSNVSSKTSRASFEEINKTFPDSEIKDFLLSKYLYDGLNANDTSVNKYMEEYFTICDNLNYVTSVETLYNLKNGKIISKLKKEVYLLNSKGERTVFSDFVKNNSGKVIYVDFWATWCAPCIKEMPYSEKLRRQFNNKDVVFLFISMDEDYFLWKEDAVTKSLSGAEGNFIFENPKNTLTEDLKISAIPRYLIIDKKGSFYQLEASRPSKDETSQTINKLLK